MRRTLWIAIAALLLALFACSDAPPASDDNLATNHATSVVLVETGSGIGSGVVIDARRVLTDAHVVWPFRQAAVQLPDGTRVTATVIGFDRFVDLALLELPESAASALAPIAIADQAHSGEPATHLGYARDAYGSFALVARAGELIDQQAVGDFKVLLLETDAAAIPGMSGGALLNQAGELLGITQFLLLPDRVFALSAADAMQRSAQLIERAASVDAPVGLRVENTAATSATFTLDGLRAHAAFLVAGALPSALSLNATSDAPITLAVLDLHGHIVSDAVRSGSGDLAVTVSIPANTARLAVVRLNAAGPALVQIEAETPLRKLLDEDHGQPIDAGTLSFAVLDYPSDIDVFDVQLPARGTVLARVTALTFDPVLQVEFVSGSRTARIASDDDSGGGLFGTNALLQFTAPVAGTYRLVVSDAGYGTGHAGGYALLISTPFVDPE